MTTIPEKEVLTDENIDETVIPEKEVKEITIPSHTVPSKIIAATKQYPNKNIVVSDIQAKQVVKLKVDIDGVISELAEYTIPTLPQDKMADIVFNFRLKLYNIPEETVEP